MCGGGQRAARAGGTPKREAEAARVRAAGAALGMKPKRGLRMLEATEAHRVMAMHLQWHGFERVVWPTLGGRWRHARAGASGSARLTGGG